jgi:hypothetical protein
MSNITKVYKHPEFSVDSMLEEMRQAILDTQAHLMNRVVTTNPALVIGSGSKAKIRVNVAIDYLRDGIRRTQIAAAEITIPAGATMTDDSTARSVYVVCYIDASDALAAVVGTVAHSGNTPTIPALPAGCVQLGHVTIAAASGTAFTAGTTFLDAAGITATYTNATVAYQNWTEPTRLGNM